MIQRRSPEKAMADERKVRAENPSSTRRNHQLTLKSREHLSLEGVVNVESFDRQEVYLETIQGGMIIRGDDLHIKELNLEESELVLTGYVHSLEYLGESLSKRGRGFLGRLFR